MVFCWYVPFFIFTILLFPVIQFLSAWINDELGEFFIMVLALPLMLYLFSKVSDPFKMVSTLATWLPPVFVGYLAAKYTWMERVYQKCGTLMKYTGTSIRMICWLIGILGVFLGKYLVPDISLNISEIPGIIRYTRIPISLDFLYVLLFTYCLINIITNCKKVLFFAVLEELGKKSMFMWFVHCVFFNNIASKTQKYLYISNNVLVVLIWGLALCYILSLVMEFIVRCIAERLDRRKHEI